VRRPSGVNPPTDDLDLSALGLYTGSGEPTSSRHRLFTCQRALLQTQGRLAIASFVSGPSRVVSSSTGAANLNVAFTAVNCRRFVFLRRLRRLTQPSYLTGAADLIAVSPAVNDRRSAVRLATVRPGFPPTFSVAGGGILVGFFPASRPPPHKQRFDVRPRATRCSLDTNVPPFARPAPLAAVLFRRTAGKRIGPVQAPRPFPTEQTPLSRP
jgi:hypothetical protein